MTDSVGKQFLKGLGQLGRETVEKSAEELMRAPDRLLGGITGNELLGDLVGKDKITSGQEKAQKDKDAMEIAKLRGELMKEKRRDVEGEMKQEWEKEKQQEEQEKKTEEQKQEEEKRREWQEQQEVVVPGKSGKRGKAPQKGKKGKPNSDEQSATKEFPRKKD